MRLLKKDDTSKAIVFLMVDSTDHITGKTGLTPTVTISKNGGTFASPSGTVSEIGNGWYKFTPAAADVDTLGPLLIHATATGADPMDIEYQVVAFDPYAATNLGLSNLDTTVSSRSSHTAADVWSVASRTITGGTVDTLTNKTGFELSAAGIDAIWDESQSGHTTAGTFGAYLNTQISSRAPADTALSNLIWTNDKASYLDAAISSRLEASSYVAPDNASISAIKSQTDKLSFVGTDVKATLDGEAVIVGSYATNQSPGEQIQGIGYTPTRAAKLDNLDASVSTRLAAASYVAPDNASIAAIKSQTDKLTFDSNNNVYAAATVDEQAIADAIVSAIGDEQLVQVIVTPIAANLIRQATHGGHIESWTHARITASWTIPGNDLSGHDLRMIIYKPSDPTTRVAEFKSDTGLTVSYNSGTGQSTISLNADPISAGNYAWIIRDQTIDTVILKGTIVVYAAPDAS